MEKEMKKKLFIFSILVLAAFLSILVFTKNVTAQDDSGVPNLVPGMDADKAADYAANPDQAAAQGKQYAGSLWGEWMKILRTNKYFGPVVIFINDIWSPISKVLLGREATASLAYVILLIAWFTVIYFVYSPARHAINLNWFLSIILGIVIASMGVRFIPQEFIESLAILWKALFFVGIFIGIAFFKIFGKSMDEKKKKEDEERRKQKAETVEKLNDIEMRASGIR